MIYSAIIIFEDVLYTIPGQKNEILNNSWFLKEPIFLFAFTAAGVVQCGGRKTFPPTSTIEQIIFYVWSFEISVNILRHQKLIIG